MKKIFTLFALAALFSCTQEILDPEVPEKPSKEDPELVNPEKDDPEVPEGMINLTFSVSSEKDADTPSAAATNADTKTEWDENTGAISWEEGDQIRIIWGTGESDYVDAEVVNDGGVYKVSAIVGDADYYYAVYPVTGAFALREGGTLDFGIPRYQNGTFASANMMAARTSKEALSFAFKNLTHIFKFHTTASNPYNRFEFTSNENAKVIANTYGVTFDEGQNVTIAARTAEISGYGNTKYADLNSIAAGKDYYFAVGPGSDFSNGFGVKARKSNSGGYELGALSKRAITTTRSKVTDLGDLDPMIHADWFIKTTAVGKGDGSSWDNAGDLSLFLKLVKYQTNDKGVNSTWRLHNARIHFAEGTYDIYEANGGTLSFGDKAWDMQADSKYQLTNLNLTIDGGYPSSNTGTSLAGKDPVTHPTLWQTAQADDTFRVFEAKGCRMSGWTFDGITFEANGDHILPGDVLHFDSTTSGTVTFNNCYFKDFVQNGTINGGPVYIHGGVTAEINFTGCTFSGNQCNVGGVAYVYAANATVKFTGCTFTGNKASNGGSIRARGGTVNITNCTFMGLGIEDGDTNTAQQGGAVYVDGASVSISGGSISNCKAANSGAIFFNNGSLSANGLAVSNCKTTAQGAGLTVAAGKTATLEDCTFTGLAAGTNGGAISNLGTLTLTNCTLTANDCAANGGAIYNEGNLTLDGTTITGKGKDTDMTALLGGGIYNKGGATATINNNSVIEGCAITGSSHHGAAIWNGGALTVDSSTLQNNINTQRGGGIYCAGTAADATITNTIFDDNDADNGGAVAVDDGSSVFINNCTFTNSTVTNGAAIRTATNSGTNVSKILVFNSLFDANTSTGGAGTQNGGTIQAAGYASILVANSTVRNNTNNSNSTGSLGTNGANCKLYIVSCTASENSDGKDFTRTSNTIEIYNSILTGTANTEHNNVLKNYSIINSTLYSTTNTKAQKGITFALGTFDNGVYPLVSTYAELSGAGMSAADIQALTFNNITLTDDQKALLAKDQKGNDRNGTIMGAYVGN